MRVDRIVKSEVPCKECLLYMVCSQICPETEEILNRDLEPIMKDIEKTLRAEYHGGSV